MSQTETVADVVRRNNDELARMVAQHPDHFAGFVAATPITDPDAATSEAIRAVGELGALGVQLEADAINIPLHEERYRPLFAAMAELGAGVWLHPSRTGGGPGATIQTPAFLPWQVFGWTFDTTMTVTQLIFAGIYDRHPDLKLIAHHGGGLIPTSPGGSRPSRVPRDWTGPEVSRRRWNASREREPTDYFRMLYVDTAMFHAQHSVRCILDFFGADRVLFGTDAPFDGQNGSYLIRQTTADVQGAVDSPTNREAIFNANANRILQTDSTAIRL